MLVYDNGEVAGSIGGGELEKAVIQDALNAMKTGESRVSRHDLLHHHQMCCGGSVEIYIEPMGLKKRLYVFGAGHTGAALASMGPESGFETYLIDDRKEYLDKVNSKQIYKLNLPFNEAMRSLPYDDQTYICILTYSHPVDREILAYCLKKPYRYLGLIGSQRKVSMIKKKFLEAAIASSDELNKVDMPMGLDIGAQTPFEIAISIMAKLIKVNQIKPIWEKELL